MNSITRFKDYYLEEKEHINQRLIEFNKKLVEEKNPLIKEDFSLFSNLNSDGKIIRGVLVNLGYYLLKDNKEYSENLSLAYEVFQTAILVHDDIIDNDNKRRGKDTIHFANYEKYKGVSKNEKEVKHFSESIALCMGDYGLYEAILIISNAYQNDKNLSKVLNNFIETGLTTLKGELIDIILPFQGKNGLLKEEELEKNILEIYRLKTAHYTIIGPLSVGLILAGASKQELKEIEEFGEKVGIAFQIQDDILGIYSDETGKVKGSDIREFKQTILYSHIMNTEYKEEFLKLYGNEELDENDIIKVQELLKKSKSYEYAFQLMNRLYDESIQVLNNIKWISEDKKEILQGFIEYLRERNK